MSQQYIIGDLFYDAFTNCLIVISDTNKMIVIDLTQKKSFRQILDDKIR